MLFRPIWPFIARSRASELDSEARNVCLCDVLAVVRAIRARMSADASNLVKMQSFPLSVRIQHFRPGACQRAQRRQKFDATTLRGVLAAAVALGRVPESLGDGPGPLLGRSWRGFGRSWKRPGRPSDALELSWRGLGRVRMRLGDAPERPRSPKTAQDRFWIDFSLIFERFFLDFRSSGLR